MKPCQGDKSDLVNFGNENPTVMKGMNETATGPGSSDIFKECWCKQRGENFIFRDLPAANLKDKSQ